MMDQNLGIHQKILALQELERQYYGSKPTSTVISTLELPERVHVLPSHAGYYQGTNANASNVTDAGCSEPKLHTLPHSSYADLVADGAYSSQLQSQLSQEALGRVQS